MYHNAIGVIYQLSKLLDEGPAPLLALDIECVQLQCWDAALLTDQNAKAAQALLEGRIRISSFWAGWSGPAAWNSVDGPHTLGIVPAAYRFTRMKELEAAADFAQKLGVADLTTHMGFIPEQPSYPEYRAVVSAVKHLADYCALRGLHFNFETGQETPVTLMRVINDTGCANLGVNLDPANLLMYGRGNPIDALDIFGGYIRGVHVKDGDYPSDDFYQLGPEKPIGEGSVNYPVFLPKLLKQGYTRDLYIEREIEGERQTADIKKAIAYIRALGPIKTV